MDGMWGARGSPKGPLVLEQQALRAAAGRQLPQSMGALHTGTCR